ncbi:VWA domain-containing protein [Quadrisphaera sp. DSM 44207]|uniref:vWA domain-containing protein n=1 Tax=Quadrisphaera sp. DSM 44207 TaxID=1881057 RepID=UPI000884835A|nr:VWA domain-containing protein [Quadrisphaera sp. DSM 44207]SDQ47255.1 Uncharacterized protein, contains von Willebrand factor type A (vWA) domain [Quadrisphaera sp. DSM 44207]
MADDRAEDRAEDRAGGRAGRPGRGPGRGFRYGAWSGGEDPLAPPYDVRAAVDALGRSVMEGRSASDALRDLLRQGPEGRRRGGLDDLAERVRRRREQLRRSGDLAGPLRQAREQLDAALAAEREELAERTPDSTGQEAADDARARESLLEGLPRSTAGAVQELASYDWQSQEARAAYQRVLDALREQVLRAHLPGLGQQGQGGQQGQRGQQGRGGEAEAGEGGEGQRGGAASEDVKELLGDLNALLAKHARGQDAPEDFERFMAKHGDAFPEQPRDVDELLDALAQRAAAAQRLLRSMSADQRRELAALIRAALADADLGAEMAALQQHLQDLRPGAFGPGRRERFTGEEPMGFDEGTGALSELADLDALADQLAQDGPGSTLDDVDVEAVERQLGPGAAADVEALKELERELRRQGWLSGASSGHLALTPKAMRRLGQSALGRVFADLRSTRRGDHDERAAGTAGEPTGTSREWRFGDEQPVDAVATARRAVLRTAAAGGLDAARADRGVRLGAEDFAVVETERRGSAAVALCVDLSWSMYAEGRWAAMKQTALALAHLVATRYPQDALQVIGFDRVARTLTTAELAAVEPAWMQGTNLQHALALARRHVGRHPSSEPVVLVVTDGEPTAHLEDDGGAFFDWPTTPETLRRTLTEVDAMTRSRVAVNTFVLGEDPGLRRFVDAIARRNGGRVFAPSPDRLGEFVVGDYLRSRASRRRAG